MVKFILLFFLKDEEEEMNIDWYNQRYVLYCDDDLPLPWLSIDIKSVLEWVLREESDKIWPLFFWSIASGLSRKYFTFE